MNRSTIYPASLLAAGLVCLNLSAACLQVDSDRILARNLVSLAPAFGKMAPDLTFGYAPPPNAERTLTIQELNTWIGQQGFTTEGVIAGCVVRATQAITDDRVTSAIKDSLKELGKPVELELVEHDKQKFALGRLEFPLSGASKPPKAQPGATFTWTGKVVTSEGRTYPVWARVRATCKRNAVRLKQAVSAQQPIVAEAIEETSVPDSPFNSSEEISADRLVGKIARHALQAGMLIESKDVQVAPDVRKGQMVQVEALAGAAQLKLMARAESSGHAGDTISLTNLEGMRRFYGVVESANLVRAVVIGPFHSKATPGVN